MQKTEGREMLKDFKTSKAHCFAATIIDCYSFVFIAVHDKRLLYPFVLSPDVFVCFRTPGTPPCRFFTCLEPFVTTWPSSHRCVWCRFEPPALATCETSKVLLAGCQVVFLGTPVSPNLPIGSSRYE